MLCDWLSNSSEKMSILLWLFTGIVLLFPLYPLVRLLFCISCHSNAFANEDAFKATAVWNPNVLRLFCEIESVYSKIVSWISTVELQRVFVFSVVWPCQVLCDH
jgi:hypothetical protein